MNYIHASFLNFRTIKFMIVSCPKNLKNINGEISLPFVAISVRIQHASFDLSFPLKAL
jgi:hypothetical protein